ncbi:MAG: hypothetical protein RIC81_01155 [Microcella pacifica]|jgi:hypothetical protein|uniref:hypothetical protein n=1 Tax=Microcella pacifica TaxID=2591847 RepID=UPI000C53CF95|nr:hypothetical protein [Leifsonia sp.]
MLSTRLRRLLPAVPVVALTIALAAAAPSFAVDSMRILSPLSGEVVSGELLIEGSITTSGPTDLTVGLAEQRLGECGPFVIERSTMVAASTAFSFTVPTQRFSDGVYCVIALAADGALSHVVGDVTLVNGIDDFGDLQLPTLGDEAPAAPVDDENEVVEAGGPFEGISTLAPVVFAATAALGMLVLVFLYVARRRLIE